MLRAAGPSSLSLSVSGLSPEFCFPGALREPAPPDGPEGLCSGLSDLCCRQSVLHLCLFHPRSLGSHHHGKPSTSPPPRGSVLSPSPEDLDGCANLALSAPSEPPPKRDSLENGGLNTCVVPAQVCPGPELLRWSRLKVTTSSGVSPRAVNPFAAC